MSHPTSYLYDSDSTDSGSDSTGSDSYDSDSDSDSDSYEVPYHNNEAEEITEQQAELEERLANSDEYMQDNDNEIESLILSKIRKRNKRKQEKRIRSIQDAYSTFTRKGRLEYNQYQFDGVQWCMDRERNKSTSQRNAYQLHKGGILGDEMGLGKTIVMLGTIYCSDYIHNRKTNSNSYSNMSTAPTPIRQTLIVVPLILLQQWAEQIEKMIGIKPLLYHGPQKFIYDVESLRTSEIILTTYHTLVYERKVRSMRSSGNITEDIYEDIDYFGANIFQEDKEEDDEEDIGDDDDDDDEEDEEEKEKEKEEDIYPDIDYFGFSMTREDDDETSLTSPRVTRGVREDNVNEVCFSLFDIQFHRVIFDEAHHLRSMNSKVYHCVCKLNTKITWMITGTPLQNKREDVIALLKLLGYRSSNFKEDEEIADILSKVFLKRTKAQVGIQIPDVKIQRVSSPWQNVHERNLSQKLHECLEPDVLRSKGVSTRMILPVMLYSRMMCVHPQMIVKHIPALDRMGIIDRNFQAHLDIEEANSKLNSVLSLLATRISNGNRKIIFTQFHQESAFLEDKIKQMKKYNFHTSGSNSESDDNEDRTDVSVGSIDGRTPKKIRDQVLQSSYDVLIIQIQTGNEGLNLQKYNEIYIVTPSWNPKLEEQAIARCHRLGQTKEVHVFKFVMEEFSSISFESPSDPVYVVDKRKRKRNMLIHNPLDSTQVGSEDGETGQLKEDAVGQKRKRDNVADFEVMEDIDEDNCDYYGEEEEDDVDVNNNKNDNTKAEETDNKRLDNKRLDNNINNNLVKLNFSSQWTGTCKNIEMYSEEMQDRKNQLEIDIGISR